MRLLGECISGKKQKHSEGGEGSDMCGKRKRGMEGWVGVRMMRM